VDTNLCWAAVRDAFVMAADRKHGTVRDFRADAALLHDGPLNVCAVAFGPDDVWVGTDHGLYAYRRRARAWCGYAVDGRHTGVPVTAVSLTEDGVRVRVRVGGQVLAYRFVPAAGRWRREG
jgi:hypothetical protein